MEYHMVENPDALRIIYKYRKLIREGRIKISLRDAKTLIGPDCAYHLYRSMENSE